MSINSERLKSLFTQLVDIYSPSGKEHQITQFLSSYLSERGAPVTLREVSDGRRNVEIIPPTGDIRLVFMGHIDTVPAFDIEKYESDERDGEIYGLGTADMKSGCAAMIEAYLSAMDDSLPLDHVALCLVVGEEENGDGTSALIREHHFPWVIIGEPTDIVPCFSHFGYIEMLIQTFGVRRHASMAGRDHNAIDTMLRMLLKFSEHVEQQFPEIKLNIRDLHSSEAGFAVPDRCESWLDIHLPPHMDPDAVVVVFRNLEDDLFKGQLGKDYKVEFQTMAKGYQLDSEEKMIREIKDICRAYGVTRIDGAFQSHSDANLLYEVGSKPVLLGPGRLSRAHTRDESVSVEQINKAAEIYRELIKQTAS